MSVRKFVVIGPGCLSWSLIMWFGRWLWSFWHFYYREKTDCGLRGRSLTLIMSCLNVIVIITVMWVVGVWLADAVIHCVTGWCVAGMDHMEVLVAHG